MGQLKAITALLSFAFICSLLTSNAMGSDEKSVNFAAQKKNSSRELIPRDGFRALFANERLADLDTFVIYLLQHDELVQTRYYFPQKHVKSDLFLIDFATVENVLRQKLGEPAIAGEVWRSGNTHENADLGRMIAVGELTLKSQWETPDMIIIHSLQGKSLDIDHEINYISKRLSRAAGKIMREIRPKHFF